MLNALRSMFCPRWFMGGVAENLPEVTYAAARVAKEAIFNQYFLKSDKIVSLAVHAQGNNPSSFYVSIGVISASDPKIKELPSKYLVKSNGTDVEVPIKIREEGEIRAQ